MNVWIENPFDSLPSEGYRPQRYWLMAKAFVRAGHSVVYWTSDFSHATKAKRVTGCETLSEQGIRVVMVPTRPYRKNVCLARILSHRAYAKAWEKLAQDEIAHGSKPDVLIASMPPLSTCSVALNLKTLTGCKLIFDVQDAWPETFLRLFPTWLKGLGNLLLSPMRQMAHVAYQGADLVTGVCDRYETLVKSYGAQAYYRAYLGIEKGETKVEGQGQDRRIRLVYVGNLGASYDLETVVEGVTRLNQRGVCATLDIAGFGGTVACHDAVRFHGLLKEDDLNTLLAQCDIGIIPMNVDSFVGLPNKLAEYAAAGLRIVSSLCGETEALLSKYACGVTYEPGNAESFASAVQAARALSTCASKRLVEEELAAERIYDGYVKKVSGLSQQPTKRVSFALKDMGWSLTGRLLIKVVQFGFSIVLARLLCPEDFGLVGMVAIFMALGSVLTDGGLVAALIRKADRTEDDYATVFWSKLAVAVFLYGVLFLCAPGVAAFYDRPDLTPVMRVITLGLPIAAGISTFIARLQVNARFRDQALVSALAILLSGVVGVVLANEGLGVWAVVGQGLSWQVIMFGLLVAVNRWLPKMRFSFASFSSLFDFGWKHMTRAVMDAIYGNASAVIVGKSFGATDLGLYNRADYYTAEIGSLVSGTVNEVNYPLLSKIQNDEALLRRSYHRLQLLVAAIMIPGMTLFAVFADVLIRVVIGSHWTPCVPYLRILAVGAALSPLVMLTFTLMYVKGRSDLALKLTLIEKPIALGLLFLALPFGIAAICVVNAVSILLTFCVNEYVVRHHL